MMESKSDVCVVCLACNTPLWPLGHNMELYKMLLGKENDLANTDVKPFSCSDCQDMFHKIQIFQEKIRSSQEILLMKLNDSLRLSNNRIDLKIEDGKNLHRGMDIDIGNSFLKANDEWKDEPFDDDTEADHQFDVDVVVIENIKQEPLEDGLKPTEVKEESPEDDQAKNKKKYYSRYKKISFNVLSGLQLLKRNYKYYIKKLMDKSVSEMEDEARLSWCYRNSKYKCRTCVRGFKKNVALQKHNEHKHAESIGPYACDFCKIRTVSKEALATHIRQHYYKYECTLCGLMVYKKWQLRTHVLIRHKKLYECPACKIIMTHSREFYRHYKAMHQRFICDHCGKVYSDRRWFENHILKVHTKFECKPCNKTFAYFRNFDAHNKLLHTTAASESTYCVECDVQFENRARYNRHISTSARHLGRTRKKSANCPECGKLYACRNNMMNHYKLEHLKVTNYQCQDCSRFFLNSFRLKEHRLVNHEKKGRAKNKICSYCGRGFSNNRILLYHIRTHTGERPHACQHCSATFAQPFALATHIKARHKDVLK